MKARCRRCKDEGFLRGPCPDCGALQVRDGTVVHEAGQFFPDVPVVAKPKKKVRVDR